MTSPDNNFEFACPECGSGLVLLDGGIEATIECPHCYAVVAPANPESAPEDQSDFVVIENSPLEFPRVEDRDFKITNVLFVWLISIFMRFVFPISALFAGAFLTVFAVFGSSVKPDANPLLLLASIPLIVAGIHSFRAGRSLASVTRGAIRSVNIFLATSVVYSLVFWIGIGLGFDNELTTGKQIGIAVVAWLFISAPILLCLCLYLNLSNRVEALYHSGIR